MTYRECTGTFTSKEEVKMYRIFPPRHGKMDGSPLGNQMETRIKTLRAGAVFCQRDRCQAPAIYLFQTGNSPVIAYCELHAKAEARRLGIELPICEANEGR